MSDIEERTEETASSLVDQLGSDPLLVAQGKLDQVMLSYLVGSDKIPNQFKPALFFLVQNDVVNKEKSYEESVVNNYFKLLNAIGGRHQEILIKAENSKQGIPVHIEPAPEKPGILDRIMDSDKVRDYERWKERKDLGLE